MPQMQEERGHWRSRDSRSRSQCVRVCATARLTPCSRPRAQRLFRLKELAVPQSQADVAGVVLGGAVLGDCLEQGTRRRRPSLDRYVDARRVRDWASAGARGVNWASASAGRTASGRLRPTPCERETPQALRPRVLCGSNASVQRTAEAGEARRSGSAATDGWARCGPYDECLGRHGSVADPQRCVLAWVTTRSEISLSENGICE